MKVFVTGATGFIGSAIVQELIGAGHDVLGLARSDANAEALTKAGAQVHRGSLEDPESLKSGAAASDGVIHTAFIHDFSNFQNSCERDKVGIDAMGEVLQGTSKPILVTGGVALIAPGKLLTENDLPPADGHFPRKSESMSDELASLGIHSSIVRLAPSVHGAGDHGFVPYLIQIAKEKGVSAYIGEGANRWPGVHRFDAAKLYRLALEKGSVGARYHGIAEEGVTTKEIAEAIGKGLGVPVVSKSQEEAAEHFGWMGFFFGMDAPASSAITQQELGWKPTGLRLLDDVEENYFN